MVENNSLERYFRGQQVCLQWLPILRALAQEMVARADVADLRQLFFQVGDRFAKDMEGRFQAVETLAQLEESLNALWQQLNWGWVTLTEAKACVDIAHEAAPLAEAFGEDALDWSVGLLEGFYQHIFKVLGAGDAMQVQGVGGSAGGMDIRLRFGHA
jgi:hypothetical protein